MKIIARSAWNPNPWKGTVHSVAISERRHFLTHYHGGPPRYDRGDANALEVWRIHNANGWAGEGYNFLVGQDGAIREGRGWNRVGAHCPGFNRTGIGVYVAIGGTQKPTDAALASVRWLYDEACRRAGRTLTKMGHRDGMATACPGTHLYAWVRAGMPAPNSTPAPSPKEDDMPLTPADISAIWSAQIGSGDNRRSIATAIARTESNSVAALARVTALEAVVKELGKGQGIDPDAITQTVEAAVRGAIEAIDVTVRTTPATQGEKS